MGLEVKSSWILGGPHVSTFSGDVRGQPRRISLRASSGTPETVDPAAGGVAWKFPSPDEGSTGGAG